jgi:hypothetical protein
MLKTLLIAFLVYVLFKFIFDLIIPAAKVASQVKRQMNGMKEQMENFQALQQQQNRAQATSPKTEKKSPTAGDYIDFEEISSK